MGVILYDKHVSILYVRGPRPRRGAIYILVYMRAPAEVKKDSHCTLCHSQSNLYN